MNSHSLSLAHHSLCVDVCAHVSAPCCLSSFRHPPPQWNLKNPHTLWHIVQHKSIVLAVIVIVLESTHTPDVCAQSWYKSYFYTHNTLMSFSINTHKEIVNVVKPKMENTTSSEPDIPIYIYITMLLVNRREHLYTHTIERHLLWRYPTSPPPRWPFLNYYKMTPSIDNQYFIMITLLPLTQ